MVKKYYETLGVSETATLEEIKKAYRKLAMRWHPDKWMNKSAGEKEKANEEMKKINKAFEVLGDEDLRKRYDLGETEFVSDSGGYDYEAEIKAEVRRKEEELRKARTERIDIELEMLKEEMKALDRSSTISGISAAFSFTYPRVFKENLDSRLWEPYQDWMEKVVKMEITIPKGQEHSEELRKFKEEMIRAIKEAETNFGTNQESKKRNWTNDRVGRTKKSAVEIIEELMTEKGLKAQDLGEYSNYQDQIDKLNKTWEIHELRDKIIDIINNWRGKTGKSDRKKGEDKDSNLPMPPEPKKDTSDQSPSKSDDKKIDYRKLTREELIKEINRKDLENDSLKEIIQALEKKVEELEEEIKELKTEPRTGEIKQKIQEKENQLREVKDSLRNNSGNNNSGNNNSGNNNSGNNFPTGWVISGGILVAIGLIALIIIKKSKKRKNIKITTNK